MGIAVAGAFGRQFLQNPTLPSGLGMTGAALYTLVNAAVIYAQTDIAVRLGARQVRRWKETPDTAPPPKERKPASAARMVRDFAVTLAGQAAFFALAHNAASNL